MPRVRRQRGAPAPLPRGRPPPGARPVVVVRIPRLTLRFPSLLDRYIARSWVANVALVLLAFASIYFLGEFMDLIDDIQQHQVKGRVIFHYYAFHVWQIGFTVAPVAVLVGVLVTLGLLARRNEITAMKAGGISVYRAAGPVLGMGLLSSLLLYGMQEWILPVTNKAAALDFNVIKGRPAQSSDQFDRRWVLASDERFYNFDYIVEREAPPARGVAEPARGGEFSVYGFSIYDVDPKTWDLRERLFAQRAAWDPGARTYDLESGLAADDGGALRLPAVHRPARAGDRPRARAARSSRRPTSGARRSPRTRWASRELRAYIASLEARGFDVAKYRVQLHRKLAFPMVGLVMTLLAVPFSFIVARRGALYGIGIAIVIAIVYWAVLEQLRGPREQRPPPPGPRRLGPEPPVRRRRPLPDPDAGRRSADRARAATVKRRRLTGTPPRRRSRSCRCVPDLHRRPVQHEDEGARLAGVEPAVGLPVDGAEARERQLDLAPLAGGAGRGEPPLEPLVGGGRVHVAHLHPEAVLAVGADEEAQPGVAREVAGLPVDERAPRERLRGRGRAEPEGQLRGVAAVRPLARRLDRRVHPRRGVELRVEGRRALERGERADLARRRRRAGPRRRPGRLASRSAASWT